MKKTQFIELIKNIQQTMVSFVSIIFFVMLGTTIFLGIGWCTKAFAKTLDKTLNDTNVHDFEISYPYGLTDESINIIKEIDSVDSVEGIYSTEAFFKVGVQNYQAKIISLTEEVDTPFNRIGDLPLKKGEIAFERFWAENHNVNIGDTIVFKHDEERSASINDILKEDFDLLQNTDVDEDGMNKLTLDTFKVVGLYENGTYISQYNVTYGVSNTTGIPNDCVAYVSKDSFDEDAMSGYTAVEVLCNSFHKDMYDSKEYKENYDNLEGVIKDKLLPYTTLRFNTINSSLINIKTNAHKELDDAIKEYDDGVKKIEDGEKQIKKGRIELSNGKKELEDGQKQIDDGWASLNAGRQQVNKALQDINIMNSAYKGAHGMVSAIVYVEDHKTAIQNGIINTHDVYASEYSLIDSELHDYLYVFDAIDDLYTRGVHLLDTPNLTPEYINFLNNIKTNSQFTSYDDIYLSVNNLSDSLPVGTQKDNIDKVVYAFMAFFGPPSDVLYLSDNIFDLYCNLKQTNADDLLNNEVIDEIDDELSTVIVPPISVKNILQKIIDDVANDRHSFNELYNAFSQSLAYIATLDYRNINTVIESYQYIIDDSYDQCYRGLADIDDAEKRLKNAQSELNTGWSEYNKNVKLLNSKERELKKGKEELAEAAVQINDAKDEIKKLDDKLPILEEYEPSVLSRNSNASIAAAGVPSAIMDSVKYTMALLFVLVGAFVCYSALSRIVYEQTVQIGTKKALGFNSKEITMFFILYAFIATTVGSILGTLLARFVVEPFILATLAKNYIVNDLLFNFDFVQSLIFYVFELTISIGATLLACKKTLKRRTTELLTNQNDTLGKKRFFEDFKVWKKMPLLIKTIINNCLNDSRRVLATLIGIVGCCSLMVCAITLIKNMYRSFDYQMENVSAFDSILYFDSDKEDALNKISIILDSKDIDYAAAQNSNYVVKSPDDTYLIFAFYSYDDEDFKNFFHLNTDGVPITDTNGIYLSKAYANNYKLKVGDNLSFLNARGEEINAPIAGIMDYYLLRAQAVVPKEYYEKVFNEPLKTNSLMFNRGDLSIDDLYRLFNNIDGFISCYDYAKDAKTMYSSLTDSLLIIVITFFVLSVILALLVLLNLMVMFVDEKKRELIVLMINGFTRGDAKKYIYGDTIVLTIIGSLLGIILGVAVGFITLKSFDSECVTIMRQFDIPAYLLCALGTALLCAFTCIIALRKIDKFDLTDINKA